MQNFYLCKEIHNGHVLRLCDLQQFTINSSFPFFLAGLCNLGNVIAISLTSESVSWTELIRSPVLCEHLLLVTRYRACGVCTEGWEWVSSSTGSTTAVCHSWPGRVGSHRATSCLRLQCDNTGVTLLQGRVNGSASALMCHTFPNVTFRCLRSCQVLCQIHVFLTCAVSYFLFVFFSFFSHSSSTRLTMKSFKAWQVGQET